MRNFICLVIFLGALQTVLHAQPPTITNQPISRVLWADGNASFVVGVSNSNSYAYQWQLNGTNLPNGIITTVAGGGSGGGLGDGSLATSAVLGGPFGVAVDTSGNLFIATVNGQRIRKVNTNGIISTVAGNGTQGYSGDNGAATNAMLSQPYDVAVDTAGNLYIADNLNSRIRKVDTNGIITTVAGIGPGGGYSGDGGTATNAGLNIPSSIVVDAGNQLFFADAYNSVIRKVDTNGIITTVAGNGMTGYQGDNNFATFAKLNNPYGIALDTTGTLFIADSGNQRIRKVGNNGIITTVVGNGVFGYSGDGGPAINAKLGYPYGLSVDGFGCLFFVDQQNNVVRKVDTNGIITTVAGNHTFEFSGNGSGDGGPATNASFSWPSDVVVDGAGNLFVASGSRIRKVTNTQRPILTLNNVGSANAGSYQLVVTGSGGSVTSSVANLIVANSPLIYQAAANPNGSIGLSFICKPGSTNLVLCATNLLPPVVWQTLSTNIAGPDGNWQFTDTNAAFYKTKFYSSQTQ